MEFSYILGTNLVDCHHFGYNRTIFLKKALLLCSQTCLHPWSGPQFIDAFFYLVNFGNVATKNGKNLVFGKISSFFSLKLEKFRTNRKNSNM